MGQDRIGYGRETVLIEASRILDTQFNAQGIWLSGAQVELLRNVMMPLNNPRTFVDEYHDGYYLTATDNDWDAIRAIVADLERKLMGNDNTIFAYHDRYFEKWENTDHDPGIQLLETMPVSAGYVHVIQHISVMQLVTASSYQAVEAWTDTDGLVLALWETVVAGMPHFTPLNLVLKEDDYIRVTFGNTAEDEGIEISIWGYQMKVPD